MLERIELEEAQDIVKENMKVEIGVEKVSLLDAHQRVLASDIISPIDHPPFHRSPLDGYALVAEDTVGASKENPVNLKIIDEIYAGGSSAKKVERGTAVRLMTGAPIPAGANCVIRQEDTCRKGERVEIFTELSPWDNYCFKGEDFKKGNPLLKKGTVLNHGEIGVLASVGINSVPIFVKPRIAVISTGDELMDINDSLIHGKIYNSNLYMLATRLRECHCDPIILGIAGDNKASISNKVMQGLKKADLVITTGGVSVGEKDLVKEIMQELGARILFWKVNIKPGTPALTSLINDKIVISLSGNPAAATITFELLVRPLLAELTKREDLKLKWFSAVFRDTFPKKSTTRRFLRGRLKEDEKGKFVTLTRGKQTSSILNSILNYNCLIDVPGGSHPLKKGETVRVVL